MDSDQVKRQIFMVGTGGQGILLLSRALAEIAVRRGQGVIASETHGMAMRGGTVTANLKIGDFASPLIPSGGADVLIGLDAAETRDFLHMLKNGGVSIVNAPSGEGFDYAMDAGKLALDEGLGAGLNMIMMGFALAPLGLALEDAREVLQAISPPRALAGNLKALELGHAASSK